MDAHFDALMDAARRSSEQGPIATLSVCISVWLIKGFAIGIGFGVGITVARAIVGT